MLCVHDQHAPATTAERGDAGGSAEHCVDDPRVEKGMTFFFCCSQQIVRCRVPSPFPSVSVHYPLLPPSYMGIYPMICTIPYGEAWDSYTTKSDAVRTGA